MPCLNLALAQGGFAAAQATFQNPLECVARQSRQHALCLNASTRSLLLPNYPKAMKLLHGVQVVWRPCWQAKLSNDGKNTEGQLRECFVIPLNRLSKHSFSGKLGGSIIGRFTIRWSRPSNYLCTGEMTTTLFSISAFPCGSNGRSFLCPE